MERRIWCTFERFSNAEVARTGDIMVTIHMKYQGDLHCQIVHGPSGTILNTDAPADNHGNAESFSPTDLVAAALGSCILTVIGIKAQSLKIDISGSTAIVEKEMLNHPVRRIRNMGVKIHIPHSIPASERRLLEDAAHTCPVHKSMHPDLEMPIEFTWGSLPESA
jgi:putative redox protein